MDRLEVYFLLKNILCKYGAIPKTEIEFIALIEDLQLLVIMEREAINATKTTA